MSPNQLPDSPSATKRVKPPLDGWLVCAIISLSAIYLFWNFHDTRKFSLAAPWRLLLLGVLPLIYWTQIGKARHGSRSKNRDRPLRASMHFSSVGNLARSEPGVVARIRTLPAWLRLSALIFLIVGLAGPQSQDRGGHIDVEGIDIMLALDLSLSMEAPDIAPNRIEAAKTVLDAFIARRRGDRIGMVVFGSEAYTQCPLTLDYAVLRNMLAGIQLGAIKGNATAIGNALALGLARLRKSDAKSRVVILLTDGDNNSGNITPREAARFARAMNVKVFSILMGSEKPMPPQRDIFGRVRTTRVPPVNPALLREIAQKTGGKAFRAGDRQALEGTFETILDELDRSTRKDRSAVYRAAFRPFISWALFLILLEALLRLTRFREFP